MVDWDTRSESEEVILIFRAGGTEADPERRETIDADVASRSNDKAHENSDPRVTLAETLAEGEQRKSLRTQRRLFEL
jgi:hypothetical protein